EHRRQGSAAPREDEGVLVFRQASRAQPASRGTHHGARGGQPFRRGDRVQGSEHGAGGRPGGPSRGGRGQGGAAGRRGRDRGEGLCGRDRCRCAQAGGLQPRRGGTRAARRQDRQGRGEPGLRPGSPPGAGVLQHARQRQGDGVQGRPPLPARRRGARARAVHAGDAAGPHGRPARGRRELPP
ncbi:unnamed protein product, partial [Scytosiphon promiscuus]